MPEFWDENVPMSNRHAGYSCSDCATTFDRFTELDAHLEFECEECDARFCHSACYDEHCDAHADWGYDEDDESRGIRNLYPWDYRPQLDYRGGMGAAYYVGTELEISAPYGANLRPLYDWTNDNGHGDLLYAKSDGSVEGFEIVSHPMTHAYFESVDWRGFFDMLNSNYDAHNGMSESEGHGIHVHVSRTAFRTPSELCKWTYLLNSNERHLNRIARRSGSRWATYSTRPVSGAWQNAHYLHGKGLPSRSISLTPYQRRMLNKVGMLRSADSLESDRYRATNLTNRNTVEVRVFRSTRRWEDYAAAVRTVVASVEYVRSLAKNATVAHVPSWQGFTEYTKDHATLAPVYPVLANV